MRTPRIGAVTYVICATTHLWPSLLLWSVSALAQSAEAPASDPKEPASPPPKRRVASETIVVTATRGLDVGEVPLAASLMGGPEVKLAPARTPDEVLQSIPSVLLPRASSTSLHPTAQGLSMRGVGRGRTLVLYDGVPLNDPFGGWIQWNKAPKPEITRIEVVRGATSNLYGNLAMGGVIQLFRRSSFEDSLDIDGEYGIFRSPHLAATATRGVFPNASAELNAEVYRTDGYVIAAPQQRGTVDKPQSFSDENAGTRFNWGLSPRALASLALNYYREERDSGTALSLNRQWIGDGSLSLDYETEGGSHWQFRLFGGLQNFHNTNTRVDSSRTSEVLALRQEIPVDHSGASLVWTRAFGKHHGLVVGLDGRAVSAENKEEVFDASGAFTGNRSSQGKQELVGLFAEWKFLPVDPLTLTAGARADYWRNHAGQAVSTAGVQTQFPTRQDAAISPRIAAVLRLTRGLALRGAAYTGFRAPNLNELYRGFFSAFQVVPNPSLGPERMRGGELGVDLSPLPQLRLGITGYYDVLSDLIQIVTLDAATRQRQNIGRATASGLEADASYRPWHPLTLSASYLFIVSRVTRFPPNPELVGKSLANTPRHRGVLSVTWSDPRLFDLVLRIRGEGAQFADDQNQFRLPEFAVVDFTAARRFREVGEFYVSATNLLDKQIITDRDSTLTRVGAPRTIWGGVRVHY